MYIEHVNLVVFNIEKTVEFYQAAFPQWSIRGSGDQVWYGKPRKWVHFGDDKYYLTFNDSGVGESRDLTSHQPGLAHFAFVVVDLESLEKRLFNAGYKRAKDGSDEPYRRNAYYLDPNGVEVEFVEYMSDLPEQRNLYR